MASIFSNHSAPSFLRTGLGALALAASLVGCGPGDELPGAEAPSESEVGAQAQDLVFFYPDLRVNFVSATSLNTVPASYNVTFRITNIGAASSSIGSASAVVSSVNGNLGRGETYDGSLQALQPNASVLRTYRCPTLGSTQDGYACVGVNVSASVSNELDPANNTLSWHP
ncbi:hypothetical protein ACLESO_11900 [Pyxidicoccus sp. 3LG]